MTYLLITPFFPSASSFRGSFIYDQVRAIQKSGKYEKVIVFKPVPYGDRTEDYIFEGVQVILFREFKLPSMLFAPFFDRLNQVCFLDRLKKLHLFPEDIHIVHSHTASLAHYAVCLKKIKKDIYTIVQYHSPDPFQIRLGRFKSWKFHQDYCTKKRINAVSLMDLHVGVSKMVLRQVQAFPETDLKSFGDYQTCVNRLGKLPRVHINDHFVLYNGVDTKKFFPQSDLSNKSDFVVGCVGNFIDWKSQKTLLQAVEIIHEKNLIPLLKVILVGSGPTYKECLDYVLDHKLEQVVRFEKEVVHSELRNFFCGLDLFVLPSVFEGFGCVFLEAYACGIPFICVEGQGISEYLPEQMKSRWAIKPYDQNSLAESICSFHKFRYKQEVQFPCDIDVLVNDFLNAAGKKRRRVSSPDDK